MFVEQFVRKFACILIAVGIITVSIGVVHMGPGAFHRGHQALIRKCISEANAREVPSVIITFHPHPQLLLRESDRRPIRLLSGIDERVYLIEKYAPVDILLVLDFNQGFSR